MKKYFNWLIESKRPWHILIGILVGFFLSWQGVVAAAAAAEFKDWLWNGHKGGIFGWAKGVKYGWDWLDFTATLLGGAIGYVLHLLIF